MNSSSNATGLPFIICIKTGPTYDFSDQVEHLAHVLSQRFCGVFLTFGPQDSTAKIGRFEVVCDAVPEFQSALAKLRYWRHATRRGIELAASARASGQRPVVLSYDPLFGGSVAASIKARAGIPMIIELNNAFGDPDNWIDIQPAWRRRLKLLQAKTFASRILNKADGIRIMHEGQLDGLRVDTTGKSVELGFDAVPLNRFTNTGEQPYILVVGYPFLRKGIDTMLCAYSRVRVDYPGWRLVLIGHDLDRRARLSGLPLVGVDLLKPVPNREIVGWVGSAGIVVVPSRSEGIPRVLLEAASASKARIGAAIHGIPRVISDGKDGLLFQKNNADQLETCIRRLISSPDLRTQLGRAAKIRVESEFGDSAYLAWVDHLVQSVLPTT